MPQIIGLLDDADQGQQLLTFSYPAYFAFDADGRESVGMPLSLDMQDQPRQPMHASLEVGADGRNAMPAGLDAHVGQDGSAILRGSLDAAGLSKHNTAPAALDAFARFEPPVGALLGLEVGGDGRAAMPAALDAEGRPQQTFAISLDAEGKPQESLGATVDVQGQQQQVAFLTGLDALRDGEDGILHAASDVETGAGVSVFVDLVDGDLDDLRA